MKSMINFDNFTEKGLKKVLDKFKKKDLPVGEVKADNRGKRQSGFLTKSATIIFESGQKLFVAIKADGGVYQVKLNGMVIPVKNYLEEGKAFNDLALRIKKNEAIYLKARAKRLSKAADKAVKAQQSGKKKKPSLSLARQIDEKTAALEVATKDVRDLKTRKTQSTQRVSDQDGIIAGYEKNIETFQKRKTELEFLRDGLKKELKNLQ